MRILRGGREIAEAEACHSLWKKARGLMFSGKKSLLFVFAHPQKVSLHMLFVFFPIWAIYINKGKEVVRMVRLFPFVSCCCPREKVRYVLETPEKLPVKVGDVLAWEDISAEKII